jgi:hypothetical protein
MTNRILTEAGDNLMMETIQGITGASSLNDTDVQEIFKERFETNPTERGWLFGADWEWNETNQRMQII